MKTLPAIGVDVGGTSIKFGVVSPVGDITHRHTLETHAEAGPDAVLERIAQGVRALMRQFPGELDGIGLGVPGVVNPRGEICHPPNFPGWEIVPVAERLRALLGTELPVVAENDANVAAYAEKFAGAGSSEDNFLYVTLGTGVGGCIISQGAIWRGATGGAGEIGHISVDLNGRPCNCGSRGCIEAYLGQRMMSAIAAEQLPDHPDSALHRLMTGDEPLNPELINRAAESGDAFAREFLREMGEILGAGLASALNLCDLHLIIVGGGMARAETFLLEPARQSLRRRLLKSLADAELRPARFGNDAGIIGAAMLT